MRELIAGVVVILVLAFASAEAQERSDPRARLFVAPIAEFDVEFGGPTRHEYVERLTLEPGCSAVVPVGKEATADFVVWFEFRKHFRQYHYMTLWDAAGHRVAGGKARGSSNIVASVCDAVASAWTGGR